MRYPAAHKAQTRARIIEAAGRLLRAEGLAGASIEKAMAGARLTVGGFYAHFRSKDELIGEALGAALKESARRSLDGLSALNGRGFVQAVIRRYVSRAHRDRPEDGCPLAPVLSELARAPDATRLAAAGGAEALIAALTPQMVGRDAAERRQNAIAVLALAMGGLSLARAINGTPLSDEVLRACRSFAEASVTDA